jgi:type II secretory ATPase GspE/PulE/Tfp pilus assembly ATPase PilB-like protein
LFSAINLDASDIHVEPQESEARLRIRLDGILQDVVFFDHNVYHHLLSRLKLLSKLKLNITDKPQDGRFTIEVGEQLIEIRTSSLPAEYGESVVMRILNPKSLINLEDLGLRSDLYEIFEKEISKPNGMIIVTGPTGSGKTTTLYAFMKKIQNPEIKIITLEDPIEYHLKGISQTQVNPEKGYTFADGLRSIVRQDPDVILVGEIRDLDTASIALQAALTGHLVLSTLHTNDAAGTIPRLIDLGTEPSSIAPALKMAVAQRLVRKVCKACSILQAPTAKELTELKKGLKNLPKNVKAPDLDKVKVAKAKEGGCPACNLTGYKGRQGLFEAFLVDSEMEKFILTNPPVSAIRDLAIKKGMVTMYQSGLLDIAEGKTTFEEVARVVEADEEKTAEAI